MTTTSRPAGGYLLENGGEQVPERWRALATLFDEPTFRRFGEIGIRSGWNCLEIGAGGGSVARWLAGRVGPAGVVTATDLDTRWLQHLRIPNLNVIQHDITRDRLPVLAYDLIHCRLVLTHLPEPETVIDRLIPALRPGGWLVLEEFDTSYLDGACHRPRTEAEHRANRIREAFTQLLEKRGAELDLPSRLPRLLAARGFEAVEVRGSFESGPAARALERANLEQVRDGLVAHGIPAAELDEHLRDLPRLPLLMPMMISVVARKWPS
ncbi:MAG TPA: class I SAM-dependent methyltransferase [Microlunatus sp.]|nr:class I SAM-dependent methyltransferase [Microlunatus sp.]